MNEKEILKEVIEKALDNGFAKHTPHRTYTSKAP